MKAVVYNGPRDVSVKNVEDARIERPTDVLVKITTTNICGSDLHMYVGAIPINDAQDSPVDQVMQMTNGLGADRGCECVGYQAHDPQGVEHPNLTMNNLVQSVKFTGGIGVVGVFVPKDPGSPDELEKQGQIAFDMGQFWFKAQTVGTGQCPVKRYNRYLANLILEGRAQPSFVVSHELPLEKAPEGYQHFDARDDGWTKVVLHPSA